MMLEIKKIVKRYDHVVALHQVSLTLKEGIYALLGPNGAGKSTLMGAITRQFSIDEGSILWNGTSIKTLKTAYFSILGYAPQQQGLYDEFSGERFLIYMALLKDIPRNQIPLEVMRVAKLVHMEEQLKKKCKAYSGGMKQRILVAQALLGNPRLLLFDEPTAGLDPKERVALRSIFSSLKRDHILLIATHVVKDVEPIVDEVIFIKKGNVIEKGSLQELMERHSSKDLESLYLSLFPDEVVEE